jgi:anti-sigma factor RsiW
MNCAETRRLIDAYVDNELDLRGALELEDHLAGCKSCGAEEKAVREMQASARANLIRHSPPPGLEARLRTALQVEEAAPVERTAAPAVSAPAPRRRARWARWEIVAPVAAAAALLLVIAPRALRPPGEASVADEAVAAHVRSLLANHLTDVASSDRHTVKPWFQGKLDYSIAVTDFAAEGYALVGGRLDYVEDKHAAALVYRHAQHLINVLVWPSAGAGDQAPQRYSRRGYNAFRWSKDGLSHWAVSDLNEAELLQLVELLRRRE